MGDRRGRMELAAMLRFLQEHYGEPEDWPDELPVWLGFEVWAESVIDIPALDLPASEPTRVRIMNGWGD